MTMVIVETRAVCGGVDTRLDFHVAAVLDHIGGLLGVETFETTEAGYRKLFEWLEGFGTVSRVGVEGTGSHGAGLSRFLLDQAVEVVEVDRPNRQLRHRVGKSDPTDAVAAARAAMSGQATVRPKLRNGPVEEMRVLMVARRSAREQRTQNLNQIRQLVFIAPEPIRSRFLGRPQQGLIADLAGLRPRDDSQDPVSYVTLTTLLGLARRINSLDAETKQIRETIEELVGVVAPSLLDVYGLGPEGAATLLVAAGDNPRRLKSEAAWAHLCGVAPIPASSGKTTRHRLNRGGNRQANAVLYRVVITRMSSHPRTRTYVSRRRDQGRTNGEIIQLRGLKTRGLVKRCAGFRHSDKQPIDEQCTRAAIRAVTRRIIHLINEIKTHEKMLRALVEEAAPQLLGEFGIGPITAAALYVAWSHPGRCRNEAAYARLAGVAPIPANSGQTQDRHRLNRGGDRQLNNALHTVAVTRIRVHPPTQNSKQRRRA